MFGSRAKSRAAETPQASRVYISGNMLSHVGRVREHNEDVVAYIVSGDPEQDMLALVADGMGGHAAGEVASRIAADTVMQRYFEDRGPPPKRLVAGFQAANKAIIDHSHTDPACAGMGTTCTALAIRDGEAYLGHIGDSRAYMWRTGTLKQISEDHSLVAQLVKDGVMTPEEAERSPDRNVIVRALGTDEKCEPAVWHDGMKIQPGDVFVLCSDGLSDLVEAPQIAITIANMAPFDACQSLIDMALAAGGTDNVSVGVFAVGDGTPLSEPTKTKPLPDPGGAS